MQPGANSFDPEKEFVHFLRAAVGKMLKPCKIWEGKRVKFRKWYYNLLLADSHLAKMLWLINSRSHIHM